jgi:hypothetical protein
MPITAKFDADFSDFVSETAKAEKALDGFGKTSEKTQSFTKGLHGSLTQFDRVLSSVGINIGSTVSAIGEIANAAGKTTRELGLFTTAGLAAGAAMAGWEFGRVVAGWLGTDAAIGKATASLLGWSDAQQVSGAKQDTINLAIKHGADATISYTEAIKYNTEWTRQHSLALDNSETRIKRWEAEIEQIAKAGNFQQFTADLASNNFTLKEISTRYHISAEALAYYDRTQKEATENAKDQQKAVDDLFKAWDDGKKIMEDFGIKTHAIAMKAMADEREARAKQLAERNDQVVKGLEQIKEVEAEYRDAILKGALSETEYKVAKIHEWEDAQINAFKGTAEQLEQFTTAVKIRAQQQVDDLTRVATTVAAVGDEYSEMYKQATTGVLVIGKGAADLATQQQDAAKATGDVVSNEYRRQQEAFMSFKGVVVAGTGEMVQQSYALETAMSKPILNASDWVTRQWALQQAQRERGEFFLTGMGGGMPTRQAGGPVTAGGAYMVGERGPEVFVPSSSGTVVPHGGGGTMVNNFYVNGSIRDLARPLMDELSRLMTQTRQWPSAT